MPNYYGTVPTAVWLWDSSADSYVNLTDDLSRLDSISRDGLGEDSDYFYVGFERRFDAAIFWLDRVGEYGQLQWEFSSDILMNGDISDTGWTIFTPIQPRSYDFRSPLDYVRWNVGHPIFDAWISGSISTGLDDVARYWVRVSSKALTTVTIGDGVSTSFEAHVIIDGGRVNEVLITDGGSGYTTDDELVFTDTANAMGARASIERVSVAGEIEEIIVLDGGSGYTTSTTVNIAGDLDTGVSVDKSILTFTSDNYTDNQEITISVATDAVVTTTTPIELNHKANGGGYDDVNFPIDVYIGADVPTPLPSLDVNSTRHIIVTPTAIRIDAGNTDTYDISLNYSPNGVQKRALLKAVSIRPYAYIASPNDVKAQLQLGDMMDEDLVPTDSTIERFIRGAEDAIYSITYHYFRPEFVEDELFNFKAYGMALRHRPVLDVLRLEIHNGSGWEQKIEGKTQDWHYEPYTGMLYVSTLFMDVVPPILRRGYSERRNQGSFKRGVRARYIHGHDASVDDFSVAVRRVVTKQACLDMLINQDFQLLLPQGLDRVTLEQKIKIWQEEIDAFKDRYAKLVMF